MLTERTSTNDEARQTGASTPDASLLERVQSTELLAESPAENSEYHAHRHIARSLRQSILEDAESRFIALLGGLGTGKSTVIRLLGKDALPDSGTDQTQDAATGNGQMLLFTFDAWTHAGESLRRSFVQELIEWLRDQDGLMMEVENRDPKSERTNTPLWNDEEDRIVRRKTTTTTTSGTAPSLVGVAFVVLTIALNAFLRGAFNNASNHSGSPWEAFLSDPFALASSIILLVLALLITSMSRKKSERKGNRTSRSSTGNTDSTTNDDRTTLVDRFTNTVTVTSADRETPSSYDVREALQTILSDVLNNHPDRKLVVVVDNIDRLTGVTEIKAALSLIQLLFDIRSDSAGDRNWMNQFWLIAPFSEQALFDAMSEELGEQTPRHLIDKPFQVQIAIPSPLYTDWRNHLRKSLNHAFKNVTSTTRDSGNGLPDGSTVEDHFDDRSTQTGRTRPVTRDDIDTIVELVANEAPKRSHLPKSKRGITQLGKINQRITRRPRDIKRFVNDLVMLYRTRGIDEISLPVLAYYVVRQIELDGSELLATVLRNSRDELLLPARLIGIAPDVLLEQMYMLDYGVGASDAGEYQLMDELDEAFNEKQVSIREGTRQAQDAINRYHDETNGNKIHNLKTILFDATQSVRTRPRMPLLIENALVIQGLDHMDSVTDELLQSFDSIIAGLESIDITKSDPAEIARYVNRRPDEHGENLRKQILRNLGNVSLADEDSIDSYPDEWAAFASDLLTYLNGSLDELSTELPIPGSPSQYLRIVQCILDTLGSFDLKVPVLDTTAFQPASFSINDNGVTKEIEMFITPIFTSREDDIRGLQTIPTALHLIQSSGSTTVSEWAWGRALRESMLFLNEVSHVSHRKTGLALPETLALLLALTRTRTIFWARYSPDPHNLLYSMLGDQRVQPLNERILAASFVFSGVRNLSLSESLFSDVDPDNDARQQAIDQIVRAPNRSRICTLIVKLCNQLDIGLNDFGTDYKPLVADLFDTRH